MINFYCWFKNISTDEYLEIIEKSAIFSMDDSKYNEGGQELCAIFKQSQLPHSHIDDILNDMEYFLKRKPDCHIKVCDDHDNEISIVQRDGRMMQH